MGFSLPKQCQNLDLIFKTAIDFGECVERETCVLKLNKISNHTYCKMHIAEISLV